MQEIKRKQYLFVFECFNLIIRGMHLLHDFVDKYFVLIYFSQHVSIISHPCKTTSKIIALCVVIYI